MTSDEKYAALGRACEANGLGWYIEDGTMRFQPPADYIAEQAAEAARAEERAEAEGEVETWKAEYRRRDEDVRKMLDRFTAEFERAETAESNLAKAEARIAELTQEVTEAFKFGWWASCTGMRHRSDGLASAQAAYAQGWRPGDPDE